MKIDPISTFFSKNSTSPVLVHSDLRYLLTLLGKDIRELLRSPECGQQILSESANLLRKIVGDRNLWIPAYNYNFCSNKSFCVERDKSQVGSFPEYYRTSIATWRTPMPVFSHCGVGDIPKWNLSPCLDPFGPESDFHQLYALDGFMLFFGVKFSPTFTHYVERSMPGGPLYRYDKIFPGTIYVDGGSHSVNMVYHVIPRGLELTYDMDGLFNELVELDLLKKLPSQFGNSFVVRVRDLHDLWVKKIAENPFALLGEKCKNRIAEIVERKGRRLILSDFEPVGDLAIV